ncbi:MAG: hypothetical protein GWO16_15925 [Gammaproteobacteria bacterium]|nr:hypothetical protein [Gammaproteobacteria bacterium]NIR32848.1 hypothetical protein [Gammaproteobacteria bacterium]NIR99395.1 hypothetical protein [Gammaproteobacteria bacterium]NIT65009.1 hypothetical protein [Gammaproteobacteria bacterium]NIV21923.1 hypothetical protein [Gammaproteobacteria bacterium]
MLAIFLLLALVAVPVARGDEARLEVIDLQHRPAGEVLPIIQPFLARDDVILHMAARRDTLSREHGGTINVQRAETTVRGPLGTWIDLGGTVEHLERRGAGTVYRARERTQQQGRLQAKVEVID